METQDLTRRGLFDWISERDQKFVPFFDIVQQEASSLGKVFFLESGQGNRFETEDMEGEELVGWLIDPEDADEFERQWSADVNTVDRSFNKSFARVLWDSDGHEVKISFT